MTHQLDNLIKNVASLDNEQKMFALLKLNQLREQYADNAKVEQALYYCSCIIRKSFNLGELFPNYEQDYSIQEYFYENVFPYFLATSAKQCRQQMERFDGIADFEPDPYEYSVMYNSKRNSIKSNDYTI